MKKNTGITKKNYWDSIYSSHKVSHQRLALDLDGYKQYLDNQIMDKIIEYYNGGNILEVGAGDSAWLIRAAKKLKPNYCSGLDYSEDGCRLLYEKSKVNQVDIDVIHCDMFAPPVDMLKRFDFILNFGVVEHFKDLSEVLVAISKLSKPGGLIFTLIPNMSGIIGTLTKLWSKDVYDIHNPHDLHSFVSGHHSANLDVVWSGYVGSTNFGVLSSCFQSSSGINYFIYKQLTRISKVLWLFESRIKPLPTTKVFSPYILVVSRVPE